MNKQAQVCSQIQKILGVQRVDRNKKYLGLPTIIGKSKKRVFTLVRDRVWQKLKSWKETSLSVTGKEIRIKAIAQAILTYVMSCFLLPLNLCQEMESMISNF